MMLRQIHTTVVTNDPEVAKLWASEEGHVTSCLPLPKGELEDQPLEEFELALALYEDVRVLQHPDQVRALKPDVVVLHAPGLITSSLAKFFRGDNIRVVGGGVIHDTLTFNTESVRNILDDMKPDQTRRFIRTDSRALRHTMTDLLWTKLRHGQDSYMVNFQSGSGLGLYDGKTMRATELAETAFLSRSWACGNHDHASIGGLLQHYPDAPQAPLVIEVVAMFSKCKGQVSQSGDMLHTGRFLKPVLAFCQIGIAQLSFLMPAVPELQDCMAKLSLMLSSLEFSGALRMRFSWDLVMGWRLFDLLPSCEAQHLAWWRQSISPDQSWHSLWHSVAKGANFDFLMSDDKSPHINIPHQDARPAHYSQEQWGQFRHFCTHVLEKVQEPEPNLEKKEGIADEQFARS